MGRFLCAEPDGTVVADRPVLSTWELFELESYELLLPPPPPSSSSSFSSGSTEEASSSSSAGASREVFAFRTFHGQYLRLADSVPSSASRPDDGGEGLLALTTAEEPTLWEMSPHRVGG